jgi:succinate dehydrogenase/fumarate reductase flavoprotein subunit
MRKSRTLFLQKGLDNLNDKTKHPAVSKDENERNTVKSGKSLHVDHIVLRCLESNRVDEEVKRLSVIFKKPEDSSSNQRKNKDLKKKYH